MLEINPGLIIWTLVTFVLLVFTLGKFAWKPIVNALHEREQSIADSLAKAEQAKKETERMIAENQSSMAKANEETARLIKEGRELAEQLKNDILVKANEQAKGVMEQARQEIQREKESALTQLRSEVADMAVTVAEKILDESLNSAKQKKMVDKVLQQLPKN